MTRDPLLEQVRGSFENKIDQDEFEICAVDLLSAIYSKLVPVVGGTDGGFDGAVSAPDGVYPLIATTAKDVIGNVRRNAKTYLESNPQGPRRVVVACTECLTQPRRKNIMKLQQELEIKIDQVYDGHWLIERLYRNPNWRKRLLRLSGDTPALSALPKHSRFDEIASVLIGRGAQQERLRGLKEDLLIVGQPGVGKTFLHQSLAEAGLCLFVIDQNRARIADEVRGGQPQCLVVDDAHLCPDFLVELIRLRYEVDADFIIHANCWPGHEQMCRQALSIASSQTVRLNLLSRDEILEVIKASGVHGPDQLLNLIIHEAAGRPGLAVEFADLCKRGEADKVWTGEALAERLFNRNRVARTRKEEDILASFSVGGESGMPLTTVAAALKLPDAEVREAVTNLDAGGVIEEVSENCLAVYSHSLRSLLVKRTFFGGAKSLQIAPLVEHALDQTETARTLMGARQRDGSVPTELIAGLMTCCKDLEAWEHFASVDEECAQHVLSQRPDRIVDAAPGLLVRLPEPALRSLLALSAAPDTHSHTRKQIAAHVGHWLHGDYTQRSEGHLERRRVLVDVIKQLVGEPGFDVVAGANLALALAPSFQGARMAPGSGNTAHFYSGVYPADHLKQIMTMWPDVLSTLNRLPLRTWVPVLETVRNWCLPGQLARLPLEDDHRAMLQNGGAQMVRDILASDKANRAVRSWAHSIGRRPSFDIGVMPDEDFEAMFGRERLGDWQAEQDRRDRHLIKMAKNLSTMSSDEAFTYIDELESEAAELNTRNNAWSYHKLYEALADVFTDHQWWVNQLVSKGRNPSFVHPFAVALLANDQIAGHETIHKFLDDVRYRRLGIRMALSLDEAGTEIIEHALEVFDPVAHADAYWLFHIPMTLSTRRALLAHKSSAIRACAAISEWVRSNNTLPPDELLPLWREAVTWVFNEQDQYQLRLILEAQPDLAFPWFVNVLAELKSATWQLDESLAEVVPLLTREQRATILHSLTASTYCERFFDALIADDLVLFGEWIDQCEDRRLVSLPLHRRPTEQWVRLACVALDHGFMQSEIARFCTAFGGDGWEGPNSVHYEEVHQEFATLLEHPDIRLHEAARRGMKITQQLIEDARADEQHEAVHGMMAGRRRTRAIRKARAI